METRKRRSRVRLKAVQGTSAGRNHRHLQLSQESEMSDDCSLASEEEEEKAKSTGGVHSHKEVKMQDPWCPQTQSVPSIPNQRTGKEVTSSLMPKKSKDALAPPKVRMSLPDHVPLNILKAKRKSYPQCPTNLQPLLHPPGPSSQQSSSDSNCSTHSSDLMSRPPAIANTQNQFRPPKRPSSQSHPNIHILARTLQHPAKCSPRSCKAHKDCPVSQFFADMASPNKMRCDSGRSSRHRSSMSDAEGVPVYDISNAPDIAENGRTASIELDATKLTDRMKTARKSLSQPFINVLPSESAGEVSHKIVVGNYYSSTDSLPTLVKPVNKEPLLKPRPHPVSKHHVHPAEGQDTPDRVRSPSSNSDSSVNPSLSAKSSISLTLGPLLTTNLRIRRSKSAVDGKWGDIGVAQLESCFPDRYIRLYVVTWNMQENKDLPDSLDELLLPLDHDVAADMFVIGTQESTPSRREWEVLIQKTLGPYYVLVQSSSIGVIYLSLFIRRDLIWFCSATSTASFATRPVTIIKTKGAVGLSFTLFGSSFLFITSHFTAGKNKVVERNADMQRIATNLSLHEDIRLASAGVSTADVTTEFDYVFWFGDLNYRVDVHRDVANECLARSDIMSLLMKDQLTREMLQMNVFPGFSEQPITFPPSYKFDMNSNIYDTSEKQRVPSWTDRILFKSRTGSGISGCGYTSCSTLRCSDHRPVCGMFRVKLDPSRHLEGVAENVAGFDREVYFRANKQRSTVMAMARATDEVDATSSTVSSISSRRDIAGRRPVTSQFCSIV